MWPEAHCHVRDFRAFSTDFAGPLLVKDTSRVSRRCGLLCFFVAIPGLFTLRCLKASRWTTFCSIGVGLCRVEVPQVQFDRITIQPLWPQPRFYEFSGILIHPQRHGSEDSMRGLSRIVKKPLKKVWGKALLRPTELVTIFCEIEQAVNKRPLTHVGALDEGQPLTYAALIGTDVWPGDLDDPDEADVIPSARQFAQ